METKFRAWDINAQRFVYAILYDRVENPFAAVPHEDGFIHQYSLNIKRWDICIEHQDEKDNDLYIGDICKIKVERLSSSSSSWYRKTNINHGLFNLHVLIAKTKGGFCLIHNEDEVSALEEPIGKEIFRQVVATIRICSDDLKNSLLVGNIYQHPHLLSKDVNNGKKI